MDNLLKNKEKEILKFMEDINEDLTKEYLERNFERLFK